MNLSIGKKIGIGFAFALLVMLAICFVSSLNLVQLNKSTFWVTHTVEVQQKVDSLLADLLQAESAVRGYQLAPDPTFKDAFEKASQQSSEDLESIHQLTSDNPQQQLRIPPLRSLLTQRYQALQKLLDLRDSNLASDDAQRVALVRSGQQSMDQIRGILTDTYAEEQRLLKERQDKAADMQQLTSDTIIGGALLAFILVGITGLLVTRSITNPVRILGEGASKIGAGNYAHRVTVKSQDEVGQLGDVFNRMASQIEHRQLLQSEQDWLKSSLAKFALLFQGQRNTARVCEGILAELATILDARHSVIYVPRQENDATVLGLEGSYAAVNPKPVLAPGEGLVGQCFVQKERVIVHEIPDDYLKISSVLGEAKPKSVVIQPALFYGEVKAVLELATLREFTPIQLAFLDQLSDSIGIVLNTIEGAMRTQALLEQAQKLSENLQVQQEELSEKNIELEDQAERLRLSEVQLQEQQEELKQTNEELEQTNEELQQTNEEMEEKVNLLAEQKRETERANLEIENARRALEEKAQQVMLASKYKSDFLANMSHELRTPLNSLLILSKILSDNGEANLTPKQIQYAQTINTSGNDLLELINEILDLSKIESGSVELERAEVQLPQIGDFADTSFRHLAEQKKLEFKIELAPELPPTITTDIRRLERVLKNLLSNAFKFTEKGAVTLRVSSALSGWNHDLETLSRADAVLAFAVTDSGIGIPTDKQQLIFEAFQQADAGTSRKYGGTGLGLSISREIASLLGGELKVQSEPGKGSTFTLYLPRTLPADYLPAKPKPPISSAGAKSRQHPSSSLPEMTSSLTEAMPDDTEVKDDRRNLSPGDNILLVIEDDLSFANIVMDFAREKGFKVLLARNAAHGIALATRLNPSAITLDLHLPDNDGWMVLDRLKYEPKTRHIPIHIISVDEERERSLRLGAVSYFQKPLTKESLEDALDQTIEFLNRPLKNLLIIEDDAVQRQSLVDLVGNGDVHSTAVGSAHDAFSAMDEIKFDCIVLDLGLPDKNGFDLIREIHQKYGNHAPPIIVYTGKELSREEETELRMISESIVIKNVRSPERLLDETALFLHRVQTKLPEPKRRMIEQVQKKETILSGRKVLVVDDDVRNIFAITSALEASQMEVSYAESGQKALEFLESHPDIEVVLMDVMMPEMDGFEATRRIRRIERFKRLPIISVTAKAMKGDREKCLEAGASDYITKPVDMDQLRSLLRVWLYK
jgi:CheY-like chemotaxis protein/signal transduction histidine kinase